MKWREVVYDVINSLQQNFDDSSISLYAATYWTVVMADKIRAQHIGKSSSGAFLTIFPQVPVSTDTITGRKYITLPTNIYDYNEDRGISFISYDYTIDDCEPPFTSVTFSRTTPASSKVLFYTSEERPEPQNPYFYRVKENIYFLGIENINVGNVEIGIYSTFNPRTVVDLDDEMEFPQELIPVLMAQVLSLGKFVLQIPTDKLNDGTQSQVAMPKQAQVPVEQEPTDQQLMQQGG